MVSCTKFLVISGITILVIGIILTIALVVSSYETVESTEVGLDYDTTSMTIDETQLYESGRHFIGVSHNFILFRYLYAHQSKNRPTANGIQGHQNQVEGWAGCADGGFILVQTPNLTRSDTVLSIHLPIRKHYHHECRIDKSQRTIRYARMSSGMSFRSTRYLSWLITEQVNSQLKSIDIE